MAFALFNSVSKRIIKFNIHKTTPRRLMELIFCASGLTLRPVLCKTPHPTPPSFKTLPTYLQLYTTIIMNMSTNYTTTTPIL